MDSARYWIWRRRATLMRVRLCGRACTVRAGVGDGLSPSLDGLWKFAQVRELRPGITTQWNGCLTCSTVDYLREAIVAAAASCWHSSESHGNLACRWPACRLLQDVRALRARRVLTTLAELKASQSTLIACKALNGSAAPHVSSSKPFDVLSCMLQPADFLRDAL